MPSRTRGVADPAPSDVAGQISELAHRGRLLDAEVEASRRRLRATREAVAQVVASAGDARGVVRATVDAHHRLLDLDIEPRALRLGSLDALRAAVLEAVQRAQADAAAQVARATDGSDGGDAVHALRERIPEVTQALRREPRPGWGA